MTNHRAAVLMRVGRKILFAVIVILGLYGLASFHYPVDDATGTAINPPGKWRQESARTFQVGTYNIHRAKGLDGKVSIKRIANALKTMNLIVLQEVNGATITGTPNQAKQLGKILDLGWLYAPTSRRLFGQTTGNALLSDFRVSSWRRQSLATSKGSSYRNYLIANILIGDQKVTVINTHIDTDTDRARQLQTVIGEFKKHYPVILLGDLNTRRHQSPLKELLADPSVTDAIRVALGKETPFWSVDWILTRGLRVLEGNIVEAGPSDHRMYSVTLEFLD